MDFYCNAIHTFIIYKYHSSKTFNVFLSLHFFSDFKGRIVQFLERNVNANDYFAYMAPAIKLLKKEMRTLEALICAIPYHKDYTRTLTLSPFEASENLLVGVLHIDTKKIPPATVPTPGNTKNRAEGEEEEEERGMIMEGDLTAVFKVCAPAVSAAPYKPHYEAGNVDVYGPGVGEQIDACVRSLENAAARELQRINEVKVLNTAYLDDIKRLHRNSEEEGTHSMRCAKPTTEDKPCNGKIVFSYTQHSQCVSASVTTAMKENRYRVKELLAPTKVPQDVFVNLFRVERVCRAICEEAARCSATEDRARVCGAAKAVLHKVLEVSAEHKVLWLVGDNVLAFLPSITTVLSSTPAGAQDLVDYMAANRRSVPALARYFRPYNCVPVFPSVLSIVLDAYDNDNLAPLLDSCNINSVNTFIFIPTTIIINN